MQFTTGFNNETQENMLGQNVVEIPHDGADDQQLSQRLSVRSDGNKGKNGYAAVDNGELEAAA